MQRDEQTDASFSCHSKKKKKNSKTQMCHGTVCLHLSLWPGWRCPSLAPINKSFTLLLHSLKQGFKVLNVRLSVYIMFNTETLIIYTYPLCNKNSFTNHTKKVFKTNPNHTWLAFAYVGTHQ